MLTDDYIESEIRKHANSDLENECCGFVVFSEKEKVNVIFPCQNQSRHKGEHFSICPKDYIRASRLGEIIAVYHSHPNQAVGEFSEFDKIQSEVHELPSILYNIKEDKFFEYEPDGYKSSYVGRMFQIGNQDCFALLRDYYKNELGINFDNFKRDELWTNDLTNFSKEKVQEIKLSPRSTFVENLNILLKKENLVEVIQGQPNVEEMMNHDIILFKYYDLDKPSHCGVYIDGNKVLHHPVRNYSRIQNYSELLRRQTYSILRHESLTHG